MPQRALSLPPSAAAQTGHIEVGQLIEWAFVLSRAVEKGLPQKYLSFGERLLDYAMKVGYDHQSGGVYGYADHDGKATAKQHRRLADRRASEDAHELGRDQGPAGPPGTT